LSAIVSNDTNVLYYLEFRLLIPSALLCWQFLGYIRCANGPLSALAMAFLNGTSDLPTDLFTHFHRPNDATLPSRDNVLYELADYIRTASLSSVANDTAISAWGMLAPVWLQRQQRVRLLEKLMSEVATCTFYF
jgi:hypothetical protein